MSKKLKVIILMLITLFTAFFESSDIVYKFGSSYPYIIKPMMWILIGVIALVFFKNNYIINKKYKKQVDFCVVVATLIYFFVYFIFGYAKGFAYSPYDRTLNGILTNIWSLVPVVVVREYLRYYMITNCGKKKIFLWTFLISLLFMLINLNFSKFEIYFSSTLNIFEFIMQTFFPNMITNLFLTYIAYFSGYGAAIVYCLLPQIVLYFLPILPDIDWQLNSIINAIIPFFTYIYINYSISKIDKSNRVKVEETMGIKSWLFMMLLIIIIVAFGLGVFPVSPIVIASNSMLPVIRKGDIVFVEKIDVKKIKKGDVIRYVLDGNYIIHRVEKINIDKDGKRVFITKGDNNYDIDIYPVKESQFAGIVRFDIPYVGYPTILLREMLNSDMGSNVKVEKGKTSMNNDYLKHTVI